MQVLEFKGIYGPVYIITDAITGFCACGDDPTKVFIATGASCDGEENGWVVTNSVAEVRAIIESAHTWQGNKE